MFELNAEHKGIKIEASEYDVEASAQWYADIGNGERISAATYNEMCKKIDAVLAKDGGLRLNVVQVARVWENDRDGVITSLDGERAWVSFKTKQRYGSRGKERINTLMLDTPENRAKLAEHRAEHKRLWELAEAEEAKMKALCLQSTAQITSLAMGSKS